MMTAGDHSGDVQPGGPFNDGSHDIGRIVNTKVNPAEADRENQRNGSNANHDTTGPGGNGRAQENGQKSKENRGGYGMPARKAIGLQFHQGVRQDRTGAVEQVFKRFVEEYASWNAQPKSSQPIPRPSK